jgi:hypothetical protein
MSKRYLVPLTDAEREALDQMNREGKADAGAFRRAVTFLKATRPRAGPTKASPGPSASPPARGSGPVRSSSSGVRDRSGSRSIRRRRPASWRTTTR